MKQYTLEIKGMRCNMCEKHVNETIKKNANVKVKNVESSFKDCSTIIIADEGLDLELISNAIKEDGFEVVNTNISDYKKKGLFK